MAITVGQLMIDEALPDDMKGKPRTLDKKGSNQLFQELAEKHPDQYRDVTHNLCSPQRGEGASGKSKPRTTSQRPSQVAMVEQIGPHDLQVRQ